MKTDLLCYIRRDRLASWKLDSLERGNRNSPVLAYGSNDPTFARFARRGNVLWVIGGSTDAPPSLEARIEISSTIDKKTEWNCEVKGSQRGSAFFGLNDASSALMQLVFKSNNSLWSLRDKYSSSEWNKSYGRDLQAPRRLAVWGELINRHWSAGAEALEQLARRAVDRSIFISWKHADNNRNRRGFIKALTNELVKRGFAVWWDQTALSDSAVVNEYSRSRQDEMMTRLLRQGISKTTAVLALWTERYGIASARGTPNWTRNEWRARRAVPRIALVFGKFANKPGMSNPDRVMSITENAEPAEAARVATWFKRIYESREN